MLLNLSCHRLNNVAKGINNILRYKSFLSIDKKNDVLIIGGGIVGCSTAYWLKIEQPNLNVTILERDITYAQASSVLSVGGVRQQFSVPENIQMSLFCYHVLSNMNKYFSTSENSDDNFDVNFMKRGYLVLSPEMGSATLTSNYKMQKQLGACSSLMSRDEIKKEWPWLNVSDIECGVYGRDYEGWFDPWLFLCYVKEKVKHLGVPIVKGTLESLHGNRNTLEIAKIKTPDGSTTDMEFSSLVNAAGAWGSEVAQMAEVGVGLSGTQFPLFVTKRKRYVYNFSCPTFPRLVATPMVMDYNGVYFRRENNGDFIGGRSPEEEEEPDCDNLDVDYCWFEDHIWPQLAYRVASMEAVKVKSAWAGYYDYNTKDQNLIIGRHPAIQNLILCNGSSGHGIQHGAAIGRANMEIIIFDQFRTIDLSRLSYNRFIDNKLIFEKNIF